MEQRATDDNKLNTRKMILTAALAVLMGSSLAGCGDASSTTPTVNVDAAETTANTAENTEGQAHEEIKLADGGRYELHLEYGEDGELIRTSSYSTADGKLNNIQEYENGKIVRSYGYGIGGDGSLHNEVTYDEDGNWTTWLVFNKDDELLNENIRNGLKDETISYSDGKPHDWNIEFYDEDDRLLRHEYYTMEEDQWELRSVSIVKHADSGESMGEEAYLGSEEKFLWTIFFWRPERWSLNQTCYTPEVLSVELYAIDQDTDPTTFYTRQTNDWETLGAVIYPAEVSDYELEYDSDGIPIDFRYTGK